MHVQNTVNQNVLLYVNLLLHVCGIKGSLTISRQNDIATMSLYRSVTISFVYRTISRQILRNILMLKRSNFKDVYNIEVFLTQILIFPIFVPHFYYVNSIVYIFHI